MHNYLELLSDIITNGVDKSDRTGIGSRSVFGRLLRWDLPSGFPIITTRKVPLRIAFEETMFFLRGETDTKILEEKKINIWKGNTSREFLDKRGLTYLPEGNMGRGYSAQWRDWKSVDHLGQTHSTDQVKILLETLKQDPNGRRHIVTGWQPGELNEMALPPCHLMNMYSVANGRLHSNWVQRSTDTPFGLPFNIMSYALLNHIFAKHLGLEPGELVCFTWDTHIYQNQMDMVKEQLTRTPRTLPSLVIHKDLPNFEDILSLRWEDVQLSGYDCYPDIDNKPEMAV